MHEFSIAQALVAAVAAEMAQPGRAGSRLVKVRVMVGALRSVVPDFLRDAYRAIARGTPAEAGEIEIAVAPAVGKCAGCGCPGEMPMGLFVCAKCGCCRSELVSGRELLLESLEVEAPEQDGVNGESGV